MLIEEEEAEALAVHPDDLGKRWRAAEEDLDLASVLLCHLPKHLRGRREETVAEPARMAGPLPALGAAARHNPMAL